MGSRMAFVAAMLVVVACLQPKAGDSGGTRANDGDCTGNPPVIEDLTMADGGWVDHGDTSVPSIVFSFDGADRDGDLHRYSVDIWFDTRVDGSVPRGEDNHIAPDPFDLGEAPCEVGRMTTQVRVTILGDEAIALGTEYEWMVVLTDASGAESPPAMIVGTTPIEEVDDGR
jgi:hypothetical protein